MRASSASTLGPSCAGAAPPCSLSAIRCAIANRPACVRRSPHVPAGPFSLRLPRSGGGAVSGPCSLSPRTCACPAKRRAARAAANRRAPAEGEVLERARTVRRGRPVRSCMARDVRGGDGFFCLEGGGGAARPPVLFPRSSRCGCCAGTEAAVA
eukprot:scaffold1486_cov329-Prasinococcus_capsulatus_cf.AAC.19